MVVHLSLMLFYLFFAWKNSNLLKYLIFFMEFSPSLFSFRNPTIVGWIVSLPIPVSKS